MANDMWKVMVVFKDEEAPTAEFGPFKGDSRALIWEKKYRKEGVIVMRPRLDKEGKPVLRDKKPLLDRRRVSPEDIKEVYCFEDTEPYVDPDVIQTREEAKVMENRRKAARRR